MKSGELVRHTSKPDWGVGVIVECTGPKCIIHFEHQGRLVLQVATVTPLLVPVSAADVASDSALLDPQRWIELTRPAEQRGRPRAGATTAASCAHCKRPLNRSRYSDRKQMKSCPRCSAVDGKEHVFHEYPAAFGQSEARVSDGTPDGAQSYCASCRSNDAPARPGRRCSSVT